MYPQNIVVVNDFPYIEGGASQVALTSAIGLSELGFPVYLFSAVDSNPHSLFFPVNLQIVNTGQHEILRDPKRIRAMFQGVWNRKAQLTFRSLLQNLNPEDTIIHVHGWTKALSSSVIRTALKLGFKIVITMHDYFLACPNGAFYNYPKREICDLNPLTVKCLLENCDSRHYYHKLWRVCRTLVQKNFGGLPDKIRYFIAVSDLNKAILSPYLPNKARIYRLDNPIDIQKLTPVSVKDNNTYVFVGRISKEKGPELFAQAAFEVGVKALFIGDGSLKGVIRSINPDAKITGWLSKEQVLEQLRKCRALIFSSVLYENQPLVVLEAAALGLPSIVPDTSAARESVVDGITGLWFKGGDIVDLAQKINQLKNDSITQSMGNAAYETFWNSPKNLESHLSGLVDIYSDILRE